MLEFQEKRRIKKIIYSPIVLVILLIVLGFLLKGVIGVYQKSAYTKENLDRVKTDFNELKQREQFLLMELEFLKSNGGKEEEIREKYGLIKENEELIMIVSDQINRQKSDYLPDQVSWWQTFMNWFKK